METVTPPKGKSGNYGFATLLLGFTTLVFAYRVSRAIYNRWFHPLSKFPGPGLSASTGLVYNYYWLKGDLVRYIDNLHRNYGAVVRLAPNRISYTDPSLWKEIYGHKSASGTKVRIMKDPQFYGGSSNGRFSLLSKFDDQEHSQLRKVFSHGFSDRALKKQEELLRGHVDKLVRNIRTAIETNPDAPIDLVKMFNSVTFDIIGDLAFGESLGLLDGDKERYEWIESIGRRLKLIPYLLLAREWPLLIPTIQFLLPAKIKNANNKLAGFTSDLVDKRISKGKVTEKPDFWTLVLEANDSDILDVPDMKANADLFMGAGSETTATMLSGLMYNLLRNPDKMNKLVREVRGAFKTGEDITIENAQTQKYLQACFDESMRIYPSTPLGPPRVVVAGGGELNGKFVPEKAKVAIATYSTFRSPSNFTDPQDFVPERWVSDDPLYPKYANDNRDAYQPFSHGPRNCIGKNLALHEMRLISASLLREFDFELCEQPYWFDQKLFWALWDKPPLWVKVRPVVKA